ncbi:MAG: hypothetical protein C4586_08330 [Anaerolineaceae bacterium]|nr:MAG: hypothetical protein C4586_08330 [Anaerolineaceae bacterium]
MKKFIKKISTINLVVLGVVLALYALGICGTADASTALFGLGLPLLFGTVAGAPGSPDYTYASGSGEIPVLFADKTVEVFYDVSVAPFVANSDYEGMIKKKGDTVVINTLPDIDISNYEVNGTINWQVLAGGKVELKVDRSKYFALRLDDVTLAQLGDKGTLDKYTKHGGEKMRIAIDTDFLADVYLEAHADNQGTTAGKSGSYNLGTTGSSIPLTKGNITDKIAECAAVANEQNWPKEGRWMVLPTWAKYLLDTSELKDVGVTGAASSFMVSGGYFKSLYDFDLYISNLYTAVSDTYSCYNITFGHKSGVTFAAQLTDMTYFDKFENTAGKGMRGIQVFDWKVIKTESLGVLYARLG